MCLFVDYNILFGELTEDVVERGFQFYTTFFNAPPAIKALLHGFMGIGILALVGKLSTWDESAMFFDGSSLAAYIFAISVYLAVTVPALRTIVTPVEGVDTRADQVEAMRVLSAGNTIMIAVLGAILVLQGGQEYAARAMAKELAKLEEEERKAKKTRPSEAGAKAGKDKQE